MPIRTFRRDISPSRTCARAIALDPDLIMFDEPFTGQDQISIGVIISLIKRLNEALNLTSIVVSHDVQSF